jgi:hypothetical protein
MTKTNFFLIEKMKLLWDRIVAPGIEWITSQDAPARHERTFDGAVFIHSLITVMRAGGIKTTSVFRQTARECHLIEPDQREDGDARPIDQRTRHIAQTRFIWIIVRMR